MIDAVSGIFERNKTDSIIDACEYAVRMHGHGAVIPRGNLEEALEHPDMTPELAEVLSKDVPDEMQLTYEIETTKRVGGE